jgi:hypothetical protein
MEIAQGATAVRDQVRTLQAMAEVKSEDAKVVMQRVTVLRYMKMKNQLKRCHNFEMQALKS